MSTSDTACIGIEGDLLARMRRVARERAIDVPHLVHEALEHEIGSGAPTPGGDEGEQAPLTCIGAFRSGRGDLSRLASEDVFEPEPFR
jgi:hypothetical protein